MALLKINTPPLIESNCRSQAVYVCVHVCVSRWAQCVCPERSALSSLAPLVPLKSTTERNEHSPNIWLSMFSSSSPSFFLPFFFLREANLLSSGFRGGSTNTSELLNMSKPASEEGFCFIFKNKRRFREQRNQDKMCPSVEKGREVMSHRVSHHL